ncbi:unconventional myosin-Ib isoform X1 [Daktulosphaira vitifoliae]|uniref:unconventional myosin-Ib isoform X1 n=1 Tax=Daktulosphaira vitifoliae TaxID=58002 RepID=UPI0021AA8C92|nr:unconventional myosin-Ib isoform X1 [Daktulosphaira vitifoliae]
MLKYGLLIDLLDKSRVTSFKSLNKNFHIFYQLVYGADIHLLKSLKLTRNSENYFYLKSSERLRQVDIYNFQTAYQTTKSSLEHLGLSELNIINIFKILSSILKLGNLTMIPTNNIDGTEGCVISNDYELYELGELLGMDGEDIKKGLTTSSNLLLGISAKEAQANKDKLSQTLYVRLFLWLMNQINQTVKTEAKYKRKCIGFLDIFGFDFTENKMDWYSFVINTCNEKVHNIVTSLILKGEQHEYVVDKLHWCLIPFYDNTSVCELLYSDEDGYLNIMDNFFNDHNNVTASKKISALKQFSESPLKEKIDVLLEKVSLNNCFMLNHFFGPMKYNISTFLEKNKNTLSPFLCSTMYNGSLSLLKELFPEDRESIFMVSNPARHLKVWAAAISTKINGRHTHYITCLSPNHCNKKNFFDTSFVQQQIRWFSLVEIVRLRRAGYCYRLTFEEFLKRYKMLSPATWPNSKYGNTVQSIMNLINCLPIPSGEFVCGTTKIFIRSPRSVWELEQLRAERLNHLALLVQEAWHRHKRNKKLFLNPKITFQTNRLCDDIYTVKRIVRTFLTWQKRRYLLKLSNRYEPSMESPICRVWFPLSNPRFALTHYLLESLHHKWRCHKYRAKLDQTTKNRMREKVTASILFKNHKASYSQSVGHPFVGDYVHLRQHIQWKRTAMQCDDHHVVFADIVNKITRSSGKFVPTLLVISTKSMLIMDQRTLQVKYRVPAADIYQLSLSPFLDNVAVFHVKSAYSSSPENDNSFIGESPTPSGCLFHQGTIVSNPLYNTYKKKGDFVFQTSHVIEIVTKMFLVIQNVSGTSPNINISTRFEANFGDQIVSIAFKYLGLPEVVPGQIKIVRKTNKMEIFV